MKIKTVILTLSIQFFFTCVYSQSLSHDIIFCGERIPVSDRFVADKLMNVIRKQIPYVNMPDLRQRTKKYFGIVEYYLRETGLPEDFKYLAIVESGFTTAVSKVGATGFWQIMPKTANDWGLIMNEYVDERNNIYKSTHAACKELARNYLYIRKNYGISSWVLAAAAYNHGIGNIEKAIKRQGKNYFQMNLNTETATYVYKIIAVKELFEYPELYMKNFGYNVFNATSVKTTQELTDTSAFSSMTLAVNESDGNHPARLDTAHVIDTNKIKTLPPKGPSVGPVRSANVKFVYAQISRKYKNFNDGDLVTFELQDDLQVDNNFIRKGTIIQWQGWKIDNRIFIDLGFGHKAILYDFHTARGISFESLKKKELVVIMIRNVS